MHLLQLWKIYRGVNPSGSILLNQNHKKKMMISLVSHRIHEEQGKHNSPKEKNQRFQGKLMTFLMAQRFKLETILIKKQPMMILISNK